MTPTSSTQRHPPSSVWLWGAFLGLVMAMLAASVGDWLYNSRRHETSQEDRRQIRENQARIVEMIDRLEKKTGPR